MGGFLSCRRALAACSGLVLSVACAQGLPDGWSPKFYDGLETVGSVMWRPAAFKGRCGAMRCVWESGARVNSRGVGFAFSAFGNPVYNTTREVRGL